MRHLILLALLIAAIRSHTVHANSEEVTDTTARIFAPASDSDTLAKAHAPWEPVDMPEKVAEPKPKNNNALYGWAVAVLAAAGMTVFIWRNSKSAS